MYYTMKIAGLERKLELFPVNDKIMIAAFIMFNDVEITKACAAELLKKAPEYDIIMTAESKGIPLAYEMARQAQKPYIVARKKEKVYMKNVISTDVDSITTKGMQTLLLGEDDVELIKGKKILIIDDVISTGGSIKSLEVLIEKACGTVAGIMAVLAEGDAQERDDIIYLEPLPLFDNEGNAI